MTSENNTTPINIENLEYRIGKFNLGPINIKLPEGVIGIIGPNGAGKTTLLRILKGLNNPSTGYLKLNNKKSSSLKRRKLVSLLEDIPSIPNNITGLEYLEIIGQLNGIDKNQVLERINELMKELPKPNNLHIKAINGSKGNIKLLALYACLLFKQDILLMDEPFEGLDQYNLELLRNFISQRELFGIKTIIISTHVIPYLNNLTDHILIIINGKIIKKINVDQDLESWDQLVEHYKVYLDQHYQSI